MLFSASEKAKLFANNFSKNSNLDDSSISLPVFPSRTNLKLHNISITAKMVTQLVSFDWSNNTGAIAVKMNGFVLEEKSSFKMLGLSFSSKLD